MIAIDQIALDGAEFDELCEYRGELFRQWLDCWNALLADEKDTYTHPLWILSWLRHDPARKSGNMALFVFRNNDSFLGLLPLQVRRLAKQLPGIYFWRSPLIGFVSSSLAMSAEYHEAALDLLFQTTWQGFGKPLMVRFQRIDETNALLRSNLVVHTRPMLPRFYRTLTGDYEDLQRELSKNFRQKLRKSYKRSVDQGKLRFETQTESEEMLKAYEEFIEIELKGWKKTSEYALQNDPVSRGFHQSLIEGSCVIPGIEMATHRLLLDEHLICVMISFFHDKTLYSLKTVYDEEFGDLSPGYLGDDYLFREICPERGITCFNIVSSAPRFSRWNPQRMETFDVCVFPRTWRGKLGWLAFRLRDKINSMRTKKIKPASD